MKLTIINKILDLKLIEHLIGGVFIGIIINIVSMGAYNNCFLWSIISFLVAIFLLFYFHNLKNDFKNQEKIKDSGQLALNQINEDKPIYKCLIFFFVIFFISSISGIYFLKNGITENNENILSQNDSFIQKINNHTDTLFENHSNNKQLKAIYLKLDTNKSNPANTTSCDSVLIYLKKLQVKK